MNKDQAREILTKVRAAMRAEVDHLYAPENTTPETRLETLDKIMDAAIEGATSEENGTEESLGELYAITLTLAAINVKLQEQVVDLERRLGGVEAFTRPIGA